MTKRRIFETLSVFIRMDVIFALQTSIVLAAADLLFHEKQASFATNPANTFLYASLRALEERSVVHIAEVLQDREKVLNLPADIRRKWDLIAHRNVISHPVMVKWRAPGMQQFFDAHRHWDDLRPALIWDMHCSINERLRALGRTPALETIPVTPAMAISLSGISRLSMNSASQTGIPSESELLEHLGKFRDRYLAS